MSFSSAVGLSLLLFTTTAGGRTADAIVQEALSVAKTVANDRLHGKGGSGGGGRSGGGGGSGGGKAGDPKDVIELTDGNFEELVINSEDYWLVEFFAPWWVNEQNNSG